MSEQADRDAEVKRFWTHVNRDGRLGCWLWTASVTADGYGCFTNRSGRTVLAHRFAWLANGGESIHGRVIDHLCRTPSCVNPDHMEAVTNRENVLRGVGPSAINARKTHCKRGHEFTPENTHIYRGHRSCRTCGRERRKRQRGEL